MSYISVYKLTLVQKNMRQMPNDYHFLSVLKDYIFIYEAKVVIEILQNFGILSIFNFALLRIYAL